MNGPSLASRYEKLSNQRQPYLDRGREASLFTLPHLLPPDGDIDHQTLSTPYQGVGAAGVKNIASKLLLTLIPPNTPFFKLVVGAEVKANANPQLLSEIEKALSKAEQQMLEHLETTTVRVAFFEALRHLVVAGNVLLIVGKDGNVRLHRLDSYVVKRDPSGHILEIIVHEKVSRDALPPEVRDEVDSKSDEFVNLYTGIKRVVEDGGKGHFAIHQEVEKTVVESSRGKFPLDKLPWLALRFNRISGESYGRGLVEEHLGDLRSLEGLSKSIVDGSAAAARILYLIDPNGTTNEKDVEEAPNLSVRIGNSRDVTTLQTEKFGDFRVALESSDRIERRLNAAFLMTVGQQTQGRERVTAEEIRFLIRELETTIGGQFSILAQEFQLPFVRILIQHMQSNKSLPQFSQDNIKPVIVTGLAAIGRGQDLDKLDAAVAGSGAILGDAMTEYLNVGEYLKRRFTAQGVNQDGLIRTQQEVDAARQQAQALQLAERVGPNAVNALANQTQET